MKTLRLGKLWNVDALIEIVDNEKILLERVQSVPYYHNEELAFSLDGGLIEIRKIKDLVLDDHTRKYPQSKFGIQIYPNLGVIKRMYEGISVDVVGHVIEDVYNGRVKGFYKMLKNKKVNPKDDKLKKMMIDIMDRIQGFDFSQYLFFDVR